MPGKRPVSNHRQPPGMAHLKRWPKEMKSDTIAILIYLGLASACLGAGAVRQDAVDVSLIRLIGSPRDYAGQLVRVVGYLHMQFEGNAIFLHQEDYERGVSMNGLSISAPPALAGC